MLNIDNQSQASRLRKELGAGSKYCTISRTFLGNSSFHLEKQVGGGSKYCIVSYTDFNNPNPTERELANGTRYLMA